FHVSFFFFQAEDGIRDFHVTGVQTCVFRSGNLVVSRRVLVPSVGGAYVRYLEVLDNPTGQEQVATVRLQSYYGAANDNQVAVVRSEERRVGKECRARRPPAR